MHLYAYQPDTEIETSLARYGIEAIPYAGNILSSCPGCNATLSKTWSPMGFDWVQPL
jgi:hypothetical protein